MNRFQQHIKQLLHILILIDFALIPLWWKWQSAPPPFSGNYVSGFVLFSALVLTCVLWMFSGFAGWRNLFRSWQHSAWVMLSLMLLCWSYLSGFWAYGAEAYPGLAPNAALQLAGVTGFALVLASTAPPPRHILTVLAVSAGLHGLIGLGQVIAQHSLGLAAFGEMTLDPARSGISIIQSGDLRWLRPYGLLPHPNVFAAVVAIGAISALMWIRSKDRRLLIGIVLFLFALWLLLLTFSRGAWIAFGAAGIVAFYGLSREKWLRGRLYQLVAGALLVGGIFILSYHPLLLSRTGIAQEGTEMRSISDRIVYNRIAWDAIQYAPVTGIGAGTFPWYAANYLFYRTNYDLRGDHVHNIYLGILAEFGVIGALLFAGWLVAGTAAAWQQINPDRLLLLAAMLFLLISGLVDHYPWTMLPTQALWFGVFAAAVHPEPLPGSLT